MWPWLKQLWTDEAGDMVENLGILLVVLGLAVLLAGIGTVMSQVGNRFEDRIPGVTFEE